MATTATTRQFLGYIWVSDRTVNTCPNFPNIPIFKANRKNMANSLHQWISFAIDFNNRNLNKPIDEAIKDGLSKSLNSLLNNQFGNYDDYNVSIAKQLHTTTYYGTQYNTLYNVFIFSGGSIPLVIADILETEQPDITDNNPTRNPLFLKIGIIQPNGDIFEVF